MSVQFAETPGEVSDKKKQVIDYLVKLKNDPNAKRINPDDYNWAKSREELKDIKESFADLVWEEREERREGEWPRS